MKDLGLTATLTLLSAATLGAQSSVLTWHNDNARTGQNAQEIILTPANVNASTFGKLFVLSVDGKVDAQPLYVPSLNIPSKGIHNVVYVETEHDSSYAFDADNGALLWKVSLLATGETTSDTRGCGQVTPEIGITGTPAIDLGIGPHGTIYVVAMSKDSGSHYHQRLHALDLTTGGEQFGGAVEIQATYPGIGVESTFDPKVHKHRAALLISNGIVYTTWSSHCDIPPYTGWVIGYNESTLQQTGVLSMTPNGNDAAIWGAGAGPAVDASGNLYTLTGNGTFDTTLDGSGFPQNDDYGNAFVKISTTSGHLAVVDYFTMSNTTSESGSDVDLGSGGLILLPALNDSGGNPRSLAVGAGKDGNIYVVDRTNLGKFHSNSDSIYQQLSGVLPGGAWSTPAWFNGKLYYGGVSDTVKAFTFTNGSFGTTPSSVSKTAFPYPGATPSISSNGASNGIVWAAENQNTAVLHAYDASDLSKELYNSTQAANARDAFGAGNKFIVPTVVNGKVYVGTTNGVGVFGLLCSYAIAPQSAPAPTGGGTQTVSVVASSGCAWTASSNASFLTINSGSGSGSGNGTVSYLVAANTGAARTGTLTIAGQTFTVMQSGGTAPTMVLSHSTLNFGVGGGVATDPQSIAVSFTGGSGVSWTASSNVSNIQVSPSSGTGNQAFMVTAGAGSNGVVTVTASGASNSPLHITVNVAGVTPAAPFGSFDTPANNTANIAGSLAITGWALDNIEVASVGIWRAPIGTEPRASNGLVFIGNAPFVAGARPDVEAAYPALPFNYRAGWGYLLLTNVLPNNGGSTGPGNGTFVLHAIATNKSGLTVDLGAHTISLDNAHASKPFGTIDTPDQGALAAGNAYVNFGWALTQNPNMIPFDGSTIEVTVDGVPLGHPTYNQFRSDIATTFPGLANSGGAVGYLRIDTTALANGTHTIAWLVTDSAGHSDGLGSRFFQVLNSGSAAAFDAAPATLNGTDRVTLLRKAHGQPESLGIDDEGNHLLTVDELDRIELRLNAASGYQVVNGERRSLPIGSTLRGGVFYWQTAPGFLGEYELEFERPGATLLRVRIIVRAKNYSLVH